MKKLIALTALVCSATFAKAQFATIRIKDNTGYTGGVYGAVTGDRYVGRPCAPDNITQPPTVLNATFTSFTPAGSVWAYTGATVLNGFIITRPDGMGNWDAPVVGLLTFCGPTSSSVIRTNFSMSGDPLTITITPIGMSQLDVVLTP